MMRFRFIKRQYLPEIWLVVHSWN